MVAQKSKKTKSSKLSKTQRRAMREKELKELEESSKEKRSLKDRLRSISWRKKLTASVLILFAVVMALSIMLPSFAGLAAKNSARQAASTEDKASSEAKTEKPTLESTNKKYEPLVARFEEKLRTNPDDLTALLHAGNNYLNWGSEAKSYAKSDEEKNQVNDLFRKAIGHFDRYLSHNPSGVVVTNRAVCESELDNKDKAIQDLENYLKDNNYAFAWFNLAKIYRAANRQDDAKNAFQKAIDADPENKAGVKKQAEFMLKAFFGSKEGKPGEGKPDEGKPGEGKPGEGKPDEGKPAPPGEEKPGEEKPAPPAEGNPAPPDKPSHDHPGSPESAPAGR